MKDCPFNIGGALQCVFIGEISRQNSKYFLKNFIIVLADIVVNFGHTAFVVPVACTDAWLACDCNCAWQIT